GIDRLTSFNPQELKSVVVKIKRKNPQVVYLPDVSPILLGIMKELSKLKVKTTVWSVYSAHIPDVLKAGAEGLIFSYPKIKENAISYFPSLGAKILFQSTEKCLERKKEFTKCVKSYLLSHYKFSKAGYLLTPLTLKVVKKGEFRDLDL
ncbi:MAG: hypothetical protein D6780_00245, partial [Candidatus Dadabacteria bacterium]